jgi:hypothetical protein
MGPSGYWVSCSQKTRERILAGGLVALGLLPALQMLLVRAARGLLHVPPGALVEFGPMAGVILLSVAPVCLLAGALFPPLARRLAETGRPAGEAYLWECAGAAAGGALFSFVLIRYLDPFQTAALILMADLSAALSLAHLPLANLRLAHLPLALLPLAPPASCPLASCFFYSPRHPPLAVVGPGLRRRFPLRSHRHPGPG